MKFNIWVIKSNFNIYLITIIELEYKKEEKKLCWHVDWIGHCILHLGLLTLILILFMAKSGYEFK